MALHQNPEDPERFAAFCTVPFTCHSCLLKLLNCVSLGDQKGDQSAVWQPEGFETDLEGL